AVLFAPRQGLPGPSREEPSRAVLWLFRLLLFRLVFSSAVVKLAGGDPTWRNLTALQYHYETQPLPTPIGWFAHQLPSWFQSFSAVGMFGIELVIPFFLFAPRQLRFLAALLIAFFQVLIALTGNYAYFSLLTLTLCVLALDDAFLRDVLPRRFVEKVVGAAPAKRDSRFRRALMGAVATLITLAGITQVAGLVLGQQKLPRPALELLARLGQFHIVSGYGLFAVMTTSRPEIVVEGSNDGQTWLAYEFKYKPGDVKRPPPVVAPHQPRLDWQMWFAALGDYRNSPWFVNFMVRLLEGSPEVLALLEKNPFPNAPPRFIRASRYDYHFTDFPGRRTSGAWWRRRFTGPYFPVASLRK
ncbi:MAG: lipase maturation factor family protein, partial [Acidobacteria bacterium]|nr:lipase maturation factor family protein [Acidobacteriota bacterium]